MVKVELKDLIMHQGFSLMGHCTQDKNNLHIEVRNLLKSKSNIILDESGAIVQLADEVIDGIYALNAKYYKCKPFKVSFRYKSDGSGIILDGTHCDFVIHFEGNFDKIIN